jgi:hypothetical protein
MKFTPGHVTKTSTREHLEKISSPESRAKGMYSCHHVLGLHDGKPRPDVCPKCREEAKD